MKNTELLEKIKQSNLEDSSFEEEADRKSWTLGAIIGVALAIIAFLLELILWGEYNFGIFTVISAVFSFKFLAEYKFSKSREALVYGILFFIVFVAVAVCYCLSLCYGWV